MLTECTLFSHAPHGCTVSLEPSTRYVRPEACSVSRPAHCNLWYTMDGHTLSRAQIRTFASSTCSGDATSSHDRTSFPLVPFAVLAGLCSAAAPAPFPDGGLTGLLRAAAVLRGLRESGPAVGLGPGRSASAICRRSSAGEWHGNSGRWSAISARMHPSDHRSDAVLHRRPAVACRITLWWPA